MKDRVIVAGQPIELGLPAQEAVKYLENDILIEPRTLESGLETIISRYANVKTEDGFVLTPDTIIEVGMGDEAQQVTVFAGHKDSDFRRKVIFQKDPSTGQPAEWIVFSGVPNTSISDGNGRSILSETERQYVRSVLEAMKMSYYRDITEKADNFDLGQHILDTLVDRIAATEADLALLTSQKEHAEQGEGVFNKFKVTILSGWEGEQPLEEEISAESLSDALSKATARFKQLNHRSDVQARSFSVSVPVGEGRFMAVPNEVILPLIKLLSTHDQEASTIERVKQGLVS